MVRRRIFLLLLLTATLTATTITLGGCSNINFEMNETIDSSNPPSTQAARTEASTQTATALESSDSTPMEDTNAVTTLNSLVPDIGMQERLINWLDITEEDSEETLYQKLSQCKSLSLEEGRFKNAFTSLDALTLFPNLENLTIIIGSWDSSRIEDFTPITQLSNLETLYISYSIEDPSVDYSFVTELEHLKNLFLPNCYIEDISFLADMPQLERLSLYNSPVDDLSVLESLPNLVELALMGNENAANLEVVGTLTKLEDLGLQACGIEDVTFLNGLTQLKALNLNTNSVSDLSPLTALTELEQLGLYENQVTDITPLKDLKKLWNLSMDYNEISDISALAELNDLNQLGLCGNQITDLSPLTGKEELLYLNVSGNPIQSLTPVWNVPIIYFQNDFDETTLTDSQTALLDYWMKELYPDISKYRCYDYKTGDINGDGYTDTAFVIDEMLLKEDGEYSPELRYMILLIQQADGTYEAVANLPFVMDTWAGGMRGEPYRGILLENGYLTLQEAWGSSTGATDTYRYHYTNGSLVLEERTQLADCNFSIGWLYNVQNEISGEYIDYAIAFDGDRLKKLFLYNNESPWHKAFVSIDIYDFNVTYDIYNTLLSTNISSTEALELCKDFAGITASKEALPYTQEQKKNAELLTGITLPDYYYEVSTDTSEEENYFYYENWESHDGQFIHIICHETPDGTHYYRLNDETGDIEFWD